MSTMVGVPVVLVKKCVTCGRTLSLSHFYDRENSKDGKRGQCKECMLKIRNTHRNEWRKNNPEAYRKQWLEYYEKNKERINEKAKREWQIFRKKVLIYIGGEKICCVRCGFSDIRALQIDHIKGDGNKDRKSWNSVTEYYYRILGMARKQAQEKYQILCANCNVIKRRENKK